MKKKFLFLIIIGVVIVAIAVAIKRQKPETEPATTNTPTNTEENPVVTNTPPTAPTAPAPTAPENAVKQPAKEFSMTSFVDFVDGKPKPQYSLKEITVKKGDFVRIKVTVTKGMHDFNIDEYNIHAATELNKETAVEFTADKAGKFIYYCSKPGHRENGHWGTLTVLE